MPPVTHSNFGGTSKRGQITDSPYTEESPSPWKSRIGRYEYNNNNNNTKNKNKRSLYPLLPHSIPLGDASILKHPQAEDPVTPQAVPNRIRILSSGKMSSRFSNNSSESDHQMDHILPILPIGLASRASCFVIFPDATVLYSAILSDHPVTPRSLSRTIATSTTQAN